MNGVQKVYRYSFAMPSTVVRFTKAKQLRITCINLIISEVQLILLGLCFVFPQCCLLG